MRDFKIVFTGPVGRGEVFMDGVKVDGVRAVKFEARAGEANVVTLEIYAKSLNVSAPVQEVEVTEIGAGSKEFARG